MKQAAIVFLAVALAAGTPALAQAPADDLARCERYYATYERYSNTGGESRSGSAASALEARSALQDCRRGNTQAGLAVLERKLRSLGYKL
jgi:hypothetical protein